MDDFTVYGRDGIFMTVWPILRLFYSVVLKLIWYSIGRSVLVQEGIVLGHLVSSRGIEVDKAKVEDRLPPPVKEVRSFLGHAGNHMRERIELLYNK